LENEPGDVSVYGKHSREVEHPCPWGWQLFRKCGRVAPHSILGEQVHKREDPSIADIVYAPFGTTCEEIGFYENMQLTPQWVHCEKSGSFVTISDAVVVGINAS